MMVNIAMIGHKRIPSREGGIEIVVDELATRMAAKGHKVIAYNRKGHNVAGAEFDGNVHSANKPFVYGCDGRWNNCSLFPYSTISPAYITAT